MKPSVLVGLLLAFLTGCALGPDYERPEVELQPAFRQPADYGESLANLEWWELYQDPVLVELINEALEQNRDRRLALERINEARALLGFTRADQFPELNVGGNVGRSEFESQPSTRGYGVSLDAFFEVDLWGKFRRATEAARADLMSTEEAYRTTTISLVASVASTYFLLRDLDARLGIARRTYKSRSDATTIIAARLERGYVAEIDLNQAQIQEADAEVVIYQTERLIGIAETALSVLLGSTPRDIPRGRLLLNQPHSIDIPVGLPSELLERRPDILQAERDLQAQFARVGVAVALRFPSIGLTASYGIASQELSNFRPDEDRFWSVGGELFGPLLSYNRNIQRVEIEKARAEQLIQVYEQSVLRALKEVEDALISFRTFGDEYRTRANQVKAARNASKLSRARYDAGETSYLEVLDTERSLFQAELAESVALRSQLVALTNLYKALGGGWTNSVTNSP